MTSLHLQPCDFRRRPIARQSVTDLLGEAARRILFTVTLWRERVRGRNELARLDLRTLQDIGLTPADRDFLVNKPFWRD